MIINQKPDGKIVVHTLAYLKADLDKVPSDERTLYLMLGSVANDTLILNKALLSCSNNSDFGSDIANQGNSTVLMFMLRMLSGRLVEAHKLISMNSKMIKSKYKSDLCVDSRNGFDGILKYFSSKRSELLDVRDRLAFHHLREWVEKGYDSIDDSMELGDYMQYSFAGNLYYTTEIIHHHTLMDIFGLPCEGAIACWLDTVNSQVSNFLNFVSGFTLVFAKRYLQDALDKLSEESEVVPVIDFQASVLPFFTLPPKSRGNQ